MAANTSVLPLTPADSEKQQAVDNEKQQAVDNEKQAVDNEKQQAVDNEEQQVVDKAVPPAEQAHDREEPQTELAVDNKELGVKKTVDSEGPCVKEAVAVDSEEPRVEQVVGEQSEKSAALRKEQERSNGDVAVVPSVATTDNKEDQKCKEDQKFDKGQTCEEDANSKAGEIIQQAPDKATDDSGHTDAKTAKPEEADTAMPEAASAAIKENDVRKEAGDESASEKNQPAQINPEATTKADGINSPDKTGATMAANSKTEKQLQQDADEVHASAATEEKNGGGNSTAESEDLVVLGGSVFENKRKPAESAGEDKPEAARKDGEEENGLADEVEGKMDVIDLTAEEIDPMCATDEQQADAEGKLSRHSDRANADQNGLQRKKNSKGTTETEKATEAPTEMEESMETEETLDQGKELTPSEGRKTTPAVENGEGSAQAEVKVKRKQPDERETIQTADQHPGKKLKREETDAAVESDLQAEVQTQKLSLQKLKEENQKMRKTMAEMAATVSKLMAFVQGKFSKEFPDNASDQ